MKSAYVPVIGLILTLAMLSSLPAATYYVSPSGSDADSGIKQSTPWRTAAKVNATHFNPGDKILFQRGGEWHEQLSASSSGTADSPIVYDAYGRGAKPRFWGSDVLDSSKWVAEGGNIYLYPGLHARITAVLANHGVGPGGQWYINFSQKPLSDLPDNFNWKDSELRINSVSDPRTDGRLYTAVSRSDIVYSNAKDHLVFRNIVGDETCQPDGGYVFRIMGSADVTLEDCEAYRGGRHHFGVINTTGFIGRRLMAAYAMPHNIVLSSSLYVSYSGKNSKYDASTSTWEDCVGEHNEDGEGGVYMYFVCHGEKTGLIRIIRPVDRGSLFTIHQENPNQRVIVKGGVVVDAVFELICDHSVTDGLTLTGNATIDIRGNDNRLQNITMVDIDPVGGGPSQSHAAICVRKGSLRNTIKSGHIAMSESAAATDSCVVLEDGNSQTRLYDSTLLSRGRALTKLGGDFAPMDLDRTNYNLYSADASFGLSDLSFKEWQAKGLADRDSRCEE